MVSAHGKITIDFKTKGGSHIQHKDDLRSEAERDSISPTAVFCPVICAAGINPVAGGLAPSGIIRTS